jgi:hypothetical protein
MRYIPPRYKLNIFPEKINHEILKINVEIKSLVDSSFTEIFLYIPEKIQVVQNNIPKNILLNKEETYTSYVLLKISENGKYEFFIQIEYKGKPSIYRNFICEYLYIEKSDTSLKFYSIPPDDFYDTIEPIEDTTEVVIEGNHHVIIQGNVNYYDQDENKRIPFPHARIWLIDINDPDDPKIVARAWTDNAGNYIIDKYLPSGYYKLCAVAINEGAWIGGGAFAGVKVFHPVYYFYIAGNTNITKYNYIN